jgi:hypothetical protein
MESGVLQWRMATAFEQNLITRKKLEAKLIQREQVLVQQFSHQNSEDLGLLEFVPDTLHFDEQNGTNYYRIEQHDESRLNSLSSTVAIRNKPQVSSPSVQTLDFEWILKNRSSQPHRKKTIFIRLKNGISVMVVAHYLLGNKPDPMISFYDLKTGVLLKEFRLAIEKEITNGFFDSSELCAVDLNHKGYVDAIYLGDNSGKLWKVYQMHKPPIDWKLQNFTLGEKGNILGQIVAGRDATGEGLLLYLLLDQGNYRSIYAVRDMNAVLTRHFTLEGSRTLSNPLLRLGYLIYSDQTRVKMNDALSGKEIQDVPMRSLFAPESSSNWLAPHVEEKFPIEMKRLVISSLGTCLMDVDGHRLGRRTWTVSSQPK